MTKEPNRIFNRIFNEMVADIELLPIYAAKFKDKTSICIDKQSVLNVINKHKERIRPIIGHWENDDWCSKCGYELPDFIIDWKTQKPNINYCPKCGAIMKEEEKKCL